MHRIGNTLRRLTMMVVVLGLFIPLGLSTTMADEASTGAQSTPQASVPQGEELSVPNGDASKEEMEPTETPSELGDPTAAVPSADPPDPTAATIVTEPVDATASATSTEPVSPTPTATATSTAPVNLTENEAALVEVTPAQPTISGNSCVDGVYTRPTATLVPTSQVNYSKVSVQWTGAGYELSASATLGAGYSWAADLGDGWTRDSAYPNSARYSRTISVDTCAPTVVPSQPTFTGNTCVDEVYTRPSASFGATAGVTYSDVAVNWAGGSYRVTANAALDDNHIWATDLGDGWDYASAREARYTGKVNPDTCAPAVVLSQPVVTNSACVDGVYTPPRGSLAATEHVTYSEVWSSPSFRDGRWVVAFGATATLDEGYRGTGENWSDSTHGSGMEYYSDELAWNACDTNVVLAQPTITGNTCIDGVYTPPSATFGPTTGVTYSNGTVSPSANDVYVLVASAMLADGYGLANNDPGGGWSEGKRGLAYNGPIEKVACEKALTVAPVNPAVTQAVRTETGAVTPPSVIPATTPGITYTVEGDVVPGGAVTVTATPNPGYALGPADGWTMQEDGAATLVVNLDDVEVEPTSTATATATATGTPTEAATATSISTATATATAINTATPTIAATATSTPTIAATSTVISTATATATGAPTEAATPTPSATAPAPTAVIVIPENPVVVQAVRTDSGAVSPPGVTLAITPGITYMVDGDAVPGSTVTVTATPDAGYVLGPASGWTIREDGSATFVIDFDALADEVVVTPQDEANASAREDKPAPDSLITSLPSTGTGSNESASREVAILTLAAGALLLAGVAVSILRSCGPMT